MRLLEYNLSHPYPKSGLFTTITLVLIALVTPVLVLVNIVVVGYELVPALRPDFQANDTVPGWWNSPRLPPLLRRSAPLCEPKDIGRGDNFRLSSSLFEYRVLSSWKSERRAPEDEGRVEYRGGSFNECFVYSMRFDYSLLEYTQTVTVGIYCPTPPVNTFLETTLVFADEISKDIVGQYYGYNIDLFSIIDEDSHDYRKAVFAVLDVISTDSLMIMGGQYLSAPVLALSTRASNITNGPSFDVTFITYLNGTMHSSSDNSLGDAEIYRASIANLMVAVNHAVLLDLGNAGPGDIFLNQSAVNSTFVPNLAPVPLDPNEWVRDSNSFYYGAVIPPYQTWAEMLRAGLPNNITLGNLTGLPTNSTMITNYLCPSYQLRPMSSFLANVFIGTATMFLSAWGAWTVLTAAIAKKMRAPCVACTCGTLLDGEKGGHTHHDHNRAVTLSGLATGLVAPPPVLRKESSTNSLAITEQDEASLTEAPVLGVPKYSAWK
ncbi:hypothetical protein BDV93DRAFT_551489 [Ceratobasidium sp. AG-I]|nr:hypothetical protein BDV93DRAFT_551489 [Ceratobasidium sp. AG-I]